MAHYGTTATITGHCETAAMSFARATRRPPLRPESPQAAGNPYGTPKS